jgi:hypothetical protein
MVAQSLLLLAANLVLGVLTLLWLPRAVRPHVAYAGGE